MPRSTDPAPAVASDPLGAIIDRALAQSTDPVVTAWLAALRDAGEAPGDGAAAPDNPECRT